MSESKSRGRRPELTKLSSKGQVVIPKEIREKLGLKEGKNNIGIWMGTGWYNPGYPGVVHNSPVVRAQLEIFNQIINRESFKKGDPMEAIVI